MAVALCAGARPDAPPRGASWALIVLMACLWSALAAAPAAAQSQPITPAQPCTPIRNLTNLPGVGVRGITNQPVLSSNGARVAFWSSNDLQPGRNVDGNLEIFVQDTAGSAKVQLTDSLGSILGGFNLAPAINQAGAQVVFYSDRDLLKNGRNRDGNFEIFLASLTGGQWEITQITDTRGSANLFPSISADGTRIAFVSDDANLHNVDATRSNPDRNFEIMLATVSGGQASFRQVTDTPLGTTNDAPSISDSGTRIAFASGSGQDVQIFVWDAAGGAPIRLTETGINEQPAI
ncbi:MAG TPA: hypothetical protein VNK95_14415, partial [Caldilineaceae bacterium]|nr:hypothetical protein [Caldilineaceae bacterium]